jgi:signal transduction histidine kinase
MFCYDEYYVELISNLRFGIFSETVPSLIYYSHFTAIIVTLLLTIFIFKAKSKLLSAKILLALGTSFSLLAFVDILLWTRPNVNEVMFFWSFWLALFIVIFSLSFYFLYTFITSKDLPLWLKGIFITLIVGVEMLSITPLNLTAYDYTYCEGLENITTINGVFFIGLIIFLGTAIFSSYQLYIIKKKTGAINRAYVYAAIGVLLFQAMFILSTYTASILNLTSISESRIFEVEQYGYIGMTLFMCFLTFIIVRFNAFNIKLAGAQALVTGIIILVGAQLFFVETRVNTVLILLTLLMSTAGGFTLVRSVKKEIQQKEKLEKLTDQLESVNTRLKDLDKLKSEFVSIASHQLRSPLTAIRGYASLVLEGSYGKVPDKAREAIERIEESSKLMALGIEDYLNVSRIEAGNMKYNISDFNLKTETEKICDDLRMDAIKRGLILIFRTDLKSKGLVTADIGKTIQIIQNLIHNSIKYTEKGSIKVLVRDDVVNRKIHIDIEDTGIGMDKETLNKIFQKFERANNANAVNISGSGLGLYVAVKMAEAMNGEIEADSDGDGKGSRFTITLPLAM